MCHRASHAPLATTHRVPVSRPLYEIRSSEFFCVEIEWVVVYGGDVRTKCTAEVEMRPQQVTCEWIFGGGIIYQDNYERTSELSLVSLLAFAVGHS